jgi:hypothetical protein
MAHSYPNKSSGDKPGNGMGHSPIRDFANPKPPPGASNSYEKIRKKIDSKDESRMNKDHYTREKMSNK